MKSKVRASDEHLRVEIHAIFEAGCRPNEITQKLRVGQTMAFSLKNGKTMLGKKRLERRRIAPSQRK
jgi:hypothetical protein